VAAEERTTPVSYKERMRDSAFASGIPAEWRRAVAGYYGGAAEHVWSGGEWARFRRNRKLPIWVSLEALGPNVEASGRSDGHDAVRALEALKVPKGCYTALDMELRVAPGYVDQFGHVLHAAGYRVFVYGSASAVFDNPQLDGYWVANYAGKGPFMFPAPAGKLVRATQYAEGEEWDSSTVKWWTYRFGHWWK
jgi:hypothetical protein